MNASTRSYIQLAAAVVLAVVGAVVVYRNLSDNVSVLAANWRALLGGAGVVGCGLWQGWLGSRGLVSIVPPVVAPSDASSRALTDEAAVWVTAAATAKRNGNQAALDAAVVGLSAVLKGGGNPTST